MKDDHHVLIVTDDAQAGKNIWAILKKIGVTAQNAANGANALKWVAGDKAPDYALIIADHTLPDMKGTDLLEQVSRILPHTQRFLTAGRADMSAIVEAVNRGKIDKFIAKPWQEEQLRGDLRAGLKQYELIMESERLFTVAKAQNIKLFTLNQDLKESAGKQKKKLAALDDELKLILKQMPQCPSFVKDQKTPVTEHESKNNPNNGHVRPPDTTKHESLGTIKHKDFHIKISSPQDRNQKRMGNQLLAELMKMLDAEMNAIAQKNGVSLR